MEKVSVATQIDGGEILQSVTSTEKEVIEKKIANDIFMTTIWITLSSIFRFSDFAAVGGQIVSFH